MDDQLSNPKYVIAYYLSRYHPRAAEWLGFKTIDECYKTFASALEENAAGIKQTADGFDPLFPNGRKGWQNELRKPAFASTVERMSHFSEFSLRTLCLSYLPDENQEST